MRILSLVLFLMSFQSWSQVHCGFDFTSYIVLHVHENGKSENISGLNITLVDANGQDAINVNNNLSWSNGGKKLFFTENYKVGVDNKRIDDLSKAIKWHFPYSKDTYLLSVTNEFAADDFQVKIEDPNLVYKTILVPLYSYNMYVLCTSQQQSMRFGRRVNKPVDIVLELR